jgi:hypothetical protein
MTNVNHDSPGFWLALIVFTVPSPPAVPGVGAFHHPALPHGDNTWPTLWTGLDVETPRGPRRSPPRVESVLMVLVVSKHHRSTRQGRGRKPCQYLPSGTAIIAAGAGETDREEEPACIHPPMTLPALDFLATVLAAFRAAALRGLARWALEAAGARCGLPSRGHAGLCASGRDDLGPGAIGTPWGAGGIDRARGEEIMGPHLPLTPTPMARPHGVEDCAQVDLARAPAAWARWSRGESWCHHRPWLVRHLGWICLARLLFLQHCRALLCCWDMR